MSQATDWSVPLSGPVTPNEMADRMDKSLDAILSSHSGASRPDYAVAGTVWLSTATAGQHKYYHYDGAADRLIMTIDTATGAVVFDGAAATIHAATAKTSMVAADELGLWDSVSSALRKITYSNFIATLDSALLRLVTGTKQMLFDLSAITNGQTRQLKMDDANVDLGRVNRMLGYDQTWQDVSASRAASTSYQNTTGRPIEVSMRIATATSRAVEVSANGSSWMTIAVMGNTDSETTSFIVPNGWYYRINGTISSISIWLELR